MCIVHIEYSTYHFSGELRGPRSLRGPERVNKVLNIALHFASKGNLFRCNKDELYYTCYYSVSKIFRFSLTQEFLVLWWSSKPWILRRILHNILSGLILWLHVTFEKKKNRIRLQPSRKNRAGSDLISNPDSDPTSFQTRIRIRPDPVPDP